ncbi:MAG: caspase family protein [Magnetococcus sp. YQC-5]
MKTLYFWLFVLFFATGFPNGPLPVLATDASLSEPPTAPILRLEAGMHTAMINRIDVDQEGQLAVTVSDDKTARLWTLPEGRLVSTLRVPIGANFDGALYAAALSPDGASLFIAGETGKAWDGKYNAYLFDTTKKKLKGILPGHNRHIRHMTYSQDGQRFAVVAGDGLFLYDTAGKIVGKDLQYESPANWVAMDRSGRIVTTSQDGYVRLYTPDVKLLAKHKFPGKEQPWSAEFSPDNALLAVGSNDTTRVEVLSTADLSIKHVPKTDGLGKGSLSSIGWIATATDPILVAGGTVADKKPDTRIIRAWNKAGQGSFQDVTVPGYVVMQIKTMPDKRAIYSTSTSWGVIHATDQQKISIEEKQRSPSSDFRNITGRRLAVAENGMTVEFTALGKKTYRFDIPSATLFPVSTPDATMTLPVTEKKPGLEITNWANSSKPLLNGQPIPIAANEVSRSLAISPDGQRFLLGSDFHLRLMDNHGLVINDVLVPAAVAGVVITKDGQKAVAALYDGTLRWYGLTKEKPLEELVSFFMDANNPQKWIAWTPEGFFDHASNGGKDLVGYHINKGRKKLPDWIGVDQLYNHLHSRAMLVNKISNRPADEQAVQKRIQENGDLTAFLQEGRLPEATPQEFCYTPSQGDAKEICAPIPMTLALKTRGRSRDSEEVSPAAGEANQAVQKAGCSVAAVASDLQTRGRTRDTSTEASQENAQTNTNQPLIRCTLPEGSDTLKIRYQVVDRGGGIGKTSLLVNGRNVDEQVVTRGRSRETENVAKTEQDDKTVKFEQQVKINEKTNIIGIRFYEKSNTSHGSVIPIEFQVMDAPKTADATAANKARGAGEASPPKSRMIVLATGINEYNGTTGWPALNFVVKDALGTVTSLHERKGSLFDQFLTVNAPNAKGEILFSDYKKENANTNILQDSQVTRTNVLAALDALAETVQSQNDSVVIYLGGHGINVQKQFYYIPIDLNSDKDERIQQAAVSGREMLERIRKINAKTGKLLLILDTCYGGAISLDGIDNLSNDAGIYMIGAASSTQQALDEFPKSGHGLFTYTLIQGLDRAAVREDKQVKVTALGDFIQEELPNNKKKISQQAEKHQQEASFKGSGTLKPFAIAVQKSK